MYNKVILLFLRIFVTSSAESQNGTITIQRCSLENQKDTIAIDFVQQ